MSPHVIVVGAGSAGCLVAARLSEDPGVQVTLLEAGPDHGLTATAPRLRSANWIDAMISPEAFDTQALAARRLGGDVRQYHRGFGLGGSGSVNAMLALPGLPRDYDRWASAYGLDQWSWDQVEPVFAALQDDLVRSPEADLTPVDAALIAAAEALGLPSDVDTYTPDDGGGVLYRNADEHGRRSSLERYLQPALDRPNLTVRTEAPIRRILLDGDRAVGVELRDGTRLDADEVVLCAGTIHTPAILARSGLRRPGLGQGLQDHPAASVFLRLKEPYRELRRELPCINGVLRLSSQHADGDIHVLPMHGALSETSPGHHAVLMAAVMTVTSVGEIRLDPDDPDGAPVVEENMLDTQRDREVMREAVERVLELLETPAIAEIVEEAFVDPQGTPASALRTDEGYERWLQGHLGDYFHAVGTARMGSAEDPAAVVDQAGRVHGWTGVRVIDCSVMPEVPAANTHLPVVMVAERLSAALREDLTATTGATTTPSRRNR